MAYRLTYANQGATRSLPLAEELERIYQLASEAAGIDEIRVGSGGQPATGPNRTGSHRHDMGGAGDISLIRGGRMLDFTNPDDLPYIQSWISNAKKFGGTGFGAGSDYMGNTTIHAGMGTPAVWGAGGKGANAPSWLREAYSGAPQGASPGISLASNPVAAAPSAMAAAPAEAENPMMAGLDEIASGLSGGKQAPQFAQMKPPSVDAEAETGDNAGAAQLMASLLDDRRRRYGMSLSGMPV